MDKIDYNFLIKSVTDELNKSGHFYNEMGEHRLVNILRIFFDKEAEKELKKLHRKRVSEKDSKSSELSKLSDVDFYRYAQRTVMEELMNHAITLGTSSVKVERNDVQ